MRLRKFIPPMSIVLFLVLTLAGTYYVRLRILEKHMASAMEMNDIATVTDLAHSFPCPVNARDKNGVTPLHRAAASGDWAMAELLLRMGADVNAKTFAPPMSGVNRGDDRRTPLHLAAGNGNKEMVEVLIAKGADVNARDSGGETPLHAAARFGEREIVELLIAKDAEINAKDHGGETPLHNAALNGRKEVVELLIAKGAEVNAKTELGEETPLHHAAEFGHKEVVELLIAKGADINAKDYQGKTPLQFAIDKKHDAVADVLRKAGAKE